MKNLRNQFKQIKRDYKSGKATKAETIDKMKRVVKENSGIFDGMGKAKK